MFGKKLLSIVGLLFIGSQIRKATAGIIRQARTECTFTHDANSGSYTTNNCGDGYYAIFPNAGDNGFNVNVNTDQKAGILVLNTGTTADVFDSGTGFFKSPDGTYIVRTSAAGNAISIVESFVECNSSNVGKLVQDGDNVKLCLADNGDGKVYGEFQTGTNTKLYILDKKEPFSSDTDGSNTSMVVEATKDSILLEDDYADANGVFCDYNDHTILTRLENFCEGTILNIRYTCSGGLCQQQETGLVTSTDYLVDNGGLKIYTCTINDNVASFAFKSVNDVVAYKAVPTDSTYFTPVTSDNLDSYTDVGNLAGIALYECVKGVCVKTSGYTKINSEGKLAKYDSSTWTLPTEGCSTQDDAGNAQISDDALQLCINGSSFGAITNNAKYFITKDNSSYDRFVVSSDSYIIGFGNKIDGNYLINTNAILTTADENTHLIECDSGVCTATPVDGTAAGSYINADNKKKLISCDGSTCTLVASPDAYYVGKDGKLINCDGENDCEAVTTAAVGYYKGASNSYIKCTAVNNCAVMNSELVNCGTDKQGQLSSLGSLCLDGSNTAVFGSNKEYLVSYHSGNIFISDSFDDETKFAVITVGEKSMTLADDINVPICSKDTNLEVIPKGEGNCPDNHTKYSQCTNGVCTQAGCDPQTGAQCANGRYYLLDTASATEVSDGTSTGHLVRCKDSGKCDSISEKGYYVNAYNEAYYTCNGVAGGCRKVDMGGSCDTTGILYYSGTEVFICLDKNEGKGANLRLGGNHMLAYVDDNPLETTSGHYALVKLTEKTVTVDTGYDNNLGYVYANTATLKVLTRGLCPDMVAGSYVTVITELDCTTKYDCVVIPQE